MSRYRVLDALGPRVYHAVAEAEGRQVVIVRAVPAQVQQRQFRDRALAQLRGAMLPRHPNVVELVELARSARDALFVVGEHVAGCSVQRLVAHGSRIGIGEAAHIAKGCCDALAHAQAHDVIHGALTPRSILVTVTGEVKLGGFGLAGVDLETEWPASSRFAYLSPEVANGLVAEPRSDLFSVGTLLWELLAGRRLFAGRSDYETVMLVREAHVPALDGIDPAFVAIVHTALARDPAARYPTARAMSAALAGFADPGTLGDRVRATQHPRSAVPVDPETRLELIDLAPI